MTDVKEKKKPKKFPDITAVTRCLRVLDEFPADTKVRIARQVLDKAMEEAGHEQRKEWEEKQAKEREFLKTQAGIQQAPMAGRGIGYG